MSEHASLQWITTDLLAAMFCHWYPWMFHYFPLANPLLDQVCFLHMAVVLTSVSISEVETVVISSILGFWLSLYFVIVHKYLSLDLKFLLLTNALKTCFLERGWHGIFKMLYLVTGVLVTVSTQPASFFYLSCALVMFVADFLSWCGLVSCHGPLNSGTSWSWMEIPQTVSPNKHSLFESCLIVLAMSHSTRKQSNSLIKWYSQRKVSRTLRAHEEGRAPAGQLTLISTNTPFNQFSKCFWYLFQ